MKTVKFYTLGCKVNQYDTQNIREQFIRAGFKELDNHKPADIYIINTCTVTQAADAESFNLIRRAKRENRRAKIIVTGCLTELDEDRIRRIKGVDLIIKNKDKDRILNQLSTRNTQYAIRDTKGISYFKGHTRAFLKVQDGCNNFCSYCKVPLVRGSSRSRPPSEILEEANRLARKGFKEIVLTGICLGAYGRDLNPKAALVDIIGELEKIEGLLRIRLSSIEAGDIGDELIDKIGQSQKLCPHLHIPIQSGDDKILRKMKRRYCRNDYHELIKKIKERVPKIAVTTDVLVGFPGESETDFQNTIHLVKEIRPLKVHIFPYSKRGGTFAADYFKDEVNFSVIRQRIWRLMDIARFCSLTYKKQFLNKHRNVLVEMRSKENPDFWQGYTDNYIKVQVKSRQNLKNKLINVKLKEIIRNFVLAHLS